MATRWGEPCPDPGCGLDKAMCLSHHDEAQDAAKETDTKMRLTLAVIQELLVEGAVEELLEQRKESMSVGLVTGALAALEDALVKRLYGLTNKDVRQAA